MDREYHKKQAEKYRDGNSGYVCAECSAGDTEIMITGDPLSLFTICKAVLSRIAELTNTDIERTEMAFKVVCMLNYEDAYHNIYGENAPRKKTIKGSDWKEKAKQDAEKQANKRNAELETGNSKLRRENEMLQNVIKALKENEGKQVKESEKQNKALQKEIRELKHKIRCLEEQK